MMETAIKLGVIPYPNSCHEDVFMARMGMEDVLVSGGQVLPLNHESAAFLRERFPFTAPVPVLRRPCTIGVGDRLGIACPGHIGAFKQFEATPVLAQQSIRELTLTGRTYEEVLDCVTFAVFREDYTTGYGADGDHLKKPEEVALALSLGYTMITLDCSEHIKGDGGLSSPDSEARARYLDKTFDVGEGVTLFFTEDDLSRAAYLYDDAIHFAVSIWERFFSGGTAADFEISIDETTTPTTPLQHFYVANELTRLGVRFATLAPRFSGEFQKGIDYIGDVNRFDSEMAVHAALARHFGYKLSIHSGSDKFSVFPSIGKHTRGVLHLKTAGTSWLEAMRVVAETSPSLYREIHAFALEAFGEASKYYHVTTDPNSIPALDTLSDVELPILFENNDARQLIHITYGLILTHGDFKARLYGLWNLHAGVYARALTWHIGRHMQELGIPEKENLAK